VAFGVESLDAPFPEPLPMALGSNHTPVDVTFAPDTPLWGTLPEGLGEGVVGIEVCDFVGV
jgi:hypothetical protein